MDDVRARMREARARMVADQLRRRDIRDERVLAAMGAVPREAFVREREWDSAYDDGPLPIGGGQTISQPFIVARMTELLGVGPGDRVLEIGTAGYQAAVLAERLLVVRSSGTRASPASARSPPGRAGLRGSRGGARGDGSFGDPAGAHVGREPGLGGSAGDPDAPATARGGAAGW